MNEEKIKEMLDEVGWFCIGDIVRIDQVSFSYRSFLCCWLVDFDFIFVYIFKGQVYLKLQIWKLFELLKVKVWKKGSMI